MKQLFLNLTHRIHTCTTLLIIAVLLVLSCFTAARALVYTGIMDNRAGFPNVPGFTAQSLAWIVGGSHGEGLRLEWQADDETTPGSWTYTYRLIRGTARNKGFAFFDVETAADFTAANITIAPVVTATTSAFLPVTGITTLGPVIFNQVHNFGFNGSNETALATILNKTDLSHYSGDPGRSPTGIAGGAASVTPSVGPVPHPFYGLRVTFPGTFNPALLSTLSYVASDWQVRFVSNRVPMWGSFFGWGDQTTASPFWYSNFYNDNIGPPAPGQPPIVRLALAPANSLTGADPYRGWILVPGPLPAVIASNPADTTVGVPLTEPVTATFGGLMDPASINLTSFTLTSGGLAVPGTVSYDAASLTASFTPTTPLAAGVTYNATISSGPGGVRDLAGNPLGTNKLWSFTTSASDLTPPTVTALLPGDGARNIATGSPLSAVFSEAIDPATLSTATFTLADNSGPLSGTVTYSPATRTATFTPLALLANNTVYTATLSTAVKDRSNNALTLDKSWSFSTIPGETILPIITTTLPLDLSVSVSVFNPITATFSEAMDPATISAASFTLNTGGAAVPGTVGYDGTTRSASFTPTSKLANSTSYTASITTAVKDLAGNSIPLTRVWSFTTGPLDLIPPTITATQPAAAAINIPLVTSVAAVFSERINPTTLGPASFTLSGQTYASSAPFTVNGTVSYNDLFTTARFSLTAALVRGTSYTATISTAVTDLAGNSLAAGKTWSFTTQPDGILLPGESAASIADALRTLRITVGLVTATADDKNHGDVAPLGLDGSPQPDGTIDIQDALVILRKVVGLITW